MYHVMCDVCHIQVLHGYAYLCIAIKKTYKAKIVAVSQVVWGTYTMYENWIQKLSVKGSCISRDNSDYKKLWYKVIRTFSISTKSVSFQSKKS